MSEGSGVLLVGDLVRGGWLLRRGLSTIRRGVELSRASVWDDPDLGDVVGLSDLSG